MKYAGIVLLGALIVALIALTYTSQLLAAVTAACVGAVTVMACVFVTMRERLDK